eukprot:875010-Alexandrium_andersonii.AAC.1
MELVEPMERLETHLKPLGAELRALSGSPSGRLRALSGHSFGQLRNLFAFDLLVAQPTRRRPHASQCIRLGEGG